MDTENRRLSTAIIAAAALLLIAGCSNSVKLLGPLYDRLDQRMVGSLSELASLDDAQLAELGTLVDRYHRWHRYQELPVYRHLIIDLRQAIADSRLSSGLSPGQHDEQHRHLTRWAGEWFGQAVSAAYRLRNCHPVNHGSQLLAGLSDQQVEELLQNLQRSRRQHRDRYDDSDADERAANRTEWLATWLDRVGLKLRPDQQQIIRDSFDRQISLRTRYFELSERWFEELATLLARRHEPSFSEDYRAHLATYWRLLEHNHPDEWQANELLWQDTTVRLISSLNTEQRRFADIWLEKLASTVGKLHEAAVSSAAVSSETDPAVVGSSAPGSGADPDIEATMASRMSCLSL